jgi:pimeloyl-ACP methyl ester carboxylesterase
VRRIAVASMPHPRRLRAAHLRDPHQVSASRHVFGFQRPVLPERRLVGQDGIEVARLLHAWSAPGWPEPDVEQCYRKAGQIPGVAHSAMESFRWAFRSLPRSDGLRYARRMKGPVQVPTLQLHGQEDPTLLVRTARGSDEYVDAPYRWRMLAEVGHFPHEEDPSGFTKELLDWLDDPDPGP